MRLSIPIDDLPGRETLPAREHRRVIVDSVIIEGLEFKGAGGMQFGRHSSRAPAALYLRRAGLRRLSKLVNEFPAAGDLHGARAVRRRC